MSQTIELAVSDDCFHLEVTDQHLEAIAANSAALRGPTSANMGCGGAITWHPGCR